ncbi:BON domain-containing protein [Cupriavidus basilensis]
MPHARPITSASPFRRDGDLSGHIGSAAERRAAKGAAWSAPGVTEVIDHLQIAP